MRDPRQRATYLAYKWLGAGLQAAPEALGSAVAAVVGEVMARRSAGPHRLAEHHVRRILASRSPEVPPDDDLVRRWARRTFRAYARYWVEGARLGGTPRAQICQRMLVQSGYEHIRDGMASGRGVVLALPHVGSWEWGGAFLAAEGMPMTSVAERIEPPELFEFFIEQRRAMGLTIVPLGRQSGAEVLRTLRGGGLVGLVCDRDMVGNGIEVELFGMRTTFPPGPATLALRTGAVLLTVAVYSGPGRDHIAVVSPPLDTERRGSLREDVERVTQEIARHFEGYIRRRPEQWHMFQRYWSDECGRDDATPGRDDDTAPGHLDAEPAR